MGLELKGAFDDSGSNKEEPYFALAGFVSDAENWEGDGKFLDRWHIVLDEKPSLEYFKRHEAFLLVDEFDGWTNAEARARIAKFVEVITWHVMLRVSSALKRSDYEQYIAGKLSPEIDDPYFLLYYNLIYSVLRFQKKNGWKIPIDFVFDQQGTLGDKVRKWFPLFCRLAVQRDPGLADYLPFEPLFLVSRFFLPLQAADLYAWNVRKSLFENRFAFATDGSALYTLTDYELPALNNMQKIDRIINVEEISTIMATLQNIKP